MLSTYAPLLAWIGFVLIVVFGMLILSELLGRPRRALGKGDTYECGVTPSGDSRTRFSVHYYLVAVLFILFDVEAVFLIPWALGARDLGMVGLIEVGVFLAVLAIGWLHIWRRGGLEWDR